MDMLKVLFQETETRTKQHDTSLCIINRTELQTHTKLSYIHI